MKALRLALAAGALSAAAGRPLKAQADASTPYDGAATYAYLEAVGRVRSQMNSDNRERIPALIRDQDDPKLRKEAERITQFRRDLDSISTDKVDPDAVQFATNMSAILAAYASVCSDSAELFREAARADRQPGSRHLVSEIGRGLKVPQTDALGAATALADVGDRLAAAAQPARLTIDPIVGKVRDDRDTLAQAKEAHHAYTATVKADLAQRYPSVDWSAAEILP